MRHEQCIQNFRQATGSPRRRARRAAPSSASAVDGASAPARSSRPDASLTARTALRSRRGHGHLRRRAPRRPARVAASDRERDLAVLEVDTGDVEPLALGADGCAAAIGAPVFALGEPRRRAGCASPPGSSRRPAASLRGPRGPPDRRRRRAHRAAAARAPRAGRSSTPRARLLGLNAVRVDGGLILALAAGAACASAPSGSPAARAPRAPASGRRCRAAPRRAPACAGRSACPSARGSSCAGSRTAARPIAPASSAAT